MKKRLLSISLVIVMMIAVMSVQAFAGDGPLTMDCPICHNGESKTSCETCSHNGTISFSSKITSENELKALFSSGGSGYLNNDIALSNQLVLSSGEVKLCLNGHVLKLPEKNITVGGSGKATLSIFDCDTTTEHNGHLDANSLWHWDTSSYSLAQNEIDFPITGGIITGGNNGIGGAVYLNKDGNAGTLNLYGGTIAGNKATDWPGGGAVYIDTAACFNMYGGKLIGNYSSRMGGAVCIQQAEFNLFSGEISRNTSADSALGGGGVSVYWPDGKTCRFNMLGGIIKQNISKGKGGGIFGDNSAAINITGGEIKENSAVTGGGIYNDAALKISNVTISGNTASAVGGGVYRGDGGSVEIGGTTKILNNTVVKGSRAFTSDLYLKNGKKITLGSNDYAPQSGMKVGVSMESGAGVFTDSAEETQAGFFFADNSEGPVKYGVKYNDSKLELEKTIEIVGAGPTLYKYTVDDAEAYPGYIYLRGWVYAYNNSQVDMPTYLPKDFYSETQNYSLIKRGDVNAAFSLPSELNTGFELRIPFKAGSYIGSENDQIVFHGRDNPNVQRLFYVNCTVPKPTATFDKQGGTGGTDYVLVDYKTSNPAIIVPARSGFAFQGYYTGENGTGDKYWNADGTAASEWLLTGSQTVYAYWRETHEHNGITFNPWDGNTSLPSEAGNWYLTTDVAISSTWIVTSGGINLDLNGHVVKADTSSTFSAITVDDGATLDLYDCGTAEHYFTVGNDGLWTLTDAKTESTETVIGGVITSGKGSQELGAVLGGGVYIKDGSFTMHGGNIVGNTAERGGGVFLLEGSSAFIMTGGLITGNKADQGGGVAVGTVQCLAAGTPITLANGEKVLIENLRRGDEVKVFDHEAGAASSAKLFDVWKYPEKHGDAFTLHFSNDIDVTVSGGHCFYEKDANKYVSVTKYNADEYIGHDFYNLDAGRWETLDGVSYLEESVDTYLIVSEKTLNCSANGMLSNEDGIYEWLADAFDFDGNMRINSAKKSSAVQQHGLFTYSDCPGFTKSAFDALNFQYMPVLFAKGLITPAQFDELVEYSLAIDPELYGEDAAPQSVLLQAQNPFMMMLGSAPAPDPVEGLAFGGAAKVSGNTKDNVYLSASNFITVGTDTNGVAAPGSGMSVGITTENEPTSATPVAITAENNVCKASYFKSDNTAYEVAAEGNSLVLRVKQAPVYPEYHADIVTKEYVMPFVDVSESDFFYDAVKWAAEKEIVYGIDETHFGPFDITSRAQMVSFLWRAAGCPEPTITACPFTDVNAGDYYYKAVLWAYEKGITEGTTSTTFSPDDDVNRAQAVTFLARLSGVKDDAKGYTHSFSDVGPTAYYNNAVAWAYENKITEGTSATTFSPDDDCLRYQIVVFLYKSFVK